MSETKSDTVQDECRGLYQELKARGLELPTAVERGVETNPIAAIDYLQSMQYFLDPDNYRQLKAEWVRKATYVAISDHKVIGHGRTIEGLVRRCPDAENELIFVGTFRSFRSPVTGSYFR